MFENSQFLSPGVGGGEVKESLAGEDTWFSGGTEGVSVVVNRV